MKQNLSYSECECGPLESQVMGDETNVKTNIEERNFTNNPTNQKPNDEQVTVPLLGIDQFTLNRFLPIPILTDFENFNLTDTDTEN